MLGYSYLSFLKYLYFKKSQGSKASYLKHDAFCFNLAITFLYHSLETELDSHTVSSLVKHSNN